MLLFMRKIIIKDVTCPSLGRLKMDEETVSAGGGSVPKVSAAQVSVAGRVKRAENRRSTAWRYQIAWWKETFSCLAGQDNR